jgi:hypothetical protein
MATTLGLPHKLKKQLQEESQKLAILHTQFGEQYKINKKSKGVIVIGCVFIAVAVFLYQGEPGLAAYIGFGIAAVVIPFAMFCIWGSKERRAEISTEQIRITDQFLDHGLLVASDGTLVHVLDEEGRPVGRGRDPMSKKSYTA